METGTISIIMSVIIIIILAIVLIVVLSSKSNTTSTTTAIPTPTYVGCFADGIVDNARQFSTKANENLNVSQCNAIAKTAGSPYFGLQFWEGAGSTIGNVGECWYGNSSTTLSKLESLGPAVCDKGTDGNMIGEGLANAIYNTV